MKYSKPMSRIGKKPVYITNGVSVTVTDTDVTVKGPKGELKRLLTPQVHIEQKKTEEGNEYLEVTVQDEKNNKAIWGTIRAHLENMVKGVSEGWTKELELNGVGFKMNLQGKKLVLSLGFSHEIEYMITDGIDASIEGNILTISGTDKELVGKTASEIRAFKKPEPYKGKGFRYTDEIIKRKAGKAAKAE